LLTICSQFTTENFQNEEERNVIMAAIRKCTSKPSLLVISGSFL
jgi:hypothetical protein